MNPAKPTKPAKPDETTMLLLEHVLELGDLMKDLAQMVAYVASGTPSEAAVTASFADNVADLVQDAELRLVKKAKLTAHLPKAASRVLAWERPVRGQPAPRSLRQGRRAGR